MTDDTEVLHHCFEELAKSDRDISSEVYQRFTASMPEADQHIGYMDSRMRGRMLDQVYRLLLDDVDEDYLQFETNMHKAYGADPGLYRGLLTAVKDSVSAAMQDSWTATHNAAWDRTIARVVDKIEQLASE